MSDESPFCFVTRHGTYKTVTGKDRGDAEQRANSNLLIRPVEFCHDGACNAEGNSLLETPRECTPASSSETESSDEKE